jgi:hypothetical protein
VHPKELLQLFRTRAAAEAPYAELSTFLRTAPSGEITEFVTGALDSGALPGTFVDSALSYVAEDDFAALVKHALTRLRSDAANEAAESVIAYASLQVPHTLQPHLQQLFALRPNRQTYYENWPWRAAGDLDIAFLSRPVLSYRHTLDGGVEALDIGSVRPEFVADPLYATTVRLAPTPARWSWQDWALSNSHENLNRIGGYPCWIQSAGWPNCASCGNDMEFFMQLDSDLRTSGNGSWLWGSGGICYAFRCARCLVTAYSWQCT